MSIEVRTVQAKDVTDVFAKRVSFLASQLRGAPVTVTREWLRNLMEFPKTWMLIGEVEGEIAGMLTLSAFPRAFGWTVWIEGVVTEENVRNRGMGRALMKKAIAISKAVPFKETLDEDSRTQRYSDRYERSLSAFLLQYSPGRDRLRTLCRV